MLYDKRWDVSVAPVVEEWVDFPATKLSPAQKLLLTSAEYLRKNGWIQNESGTGGGPACLVGSLVFSMNHCDPTTVAAMNRLSEYLKHTESTACLPLAAPFCAGI